MPQQNFFDKLAVFAKQPEKLSTRIVRGAMEDPRKLFLAIGVIAAMGAASAMMPSPQTASYGTGISHTIEAGIIALPKIVKNDEAIATFEGRLRFAKISPSKDGSRKGRYLFPDFDKECTYVEYSHIKGGINCFRDQKSPDFIRADMEKHIKTYQTQIDIFPNYVIEYFGKNHSIKYDFSHKFIGKTAPTLEFTNKSERGLISFITEGDIGEKHTDNLYRLMKQAYASKAAAEKAALRNQPTAAPR